MKLLEGIDNPDIFVGRTEVRVKKIEVLMGRETIKEITRGIVVKNFGAFVQVFNYSEPSEGGDVTIYTSETFPVKSKMCWIEVVKTRDEAQKIRIPADL